jgi:predicted house-cleaning noncanonical NTP pyrophosphatase (MazG superfamily)
MLGAMKAHHGKLVRDRIPGMLAERGIPHEIRVADRTELPALLHAKLEEEAAECLAATNDAARIEELADMLEVILGLGRFYGADRDALERARAQKAIERGAFEARIVLISAGTDDENVGPNG